MRHRIIASVVFLLLAYTSFSLKIYRYTEEMSSPKHLVLEEQFLATVKEEGWEFKMKVPMNTNESSFVYILDRKHCPEGILASILGKDASDIHQLSQYMGSNDVVFLLDGEKVDAFLIIRFYAKTVRANVMRFFDESKPLPLALSVYSPVDNKKCRLFS